MRGLAEMRGWPRTVLEGEQGCPQRCPCSRDARLEKVHVKHVQLKTSHDSPACVNAHIKGALLEGTIGREHESD